MSRSNKPGRPWSAVAERTVLGYLILCPAYIEGVAQALTVDDFFDPKHKALFKKIVELGSDFTEARFFEAAKPLIDKFKDLDYSYISSLHDWAIGDEHARKNIEHLQSLSRIRRLIDNASKIAHEASQASYRPDDEWIDDAERRLLSALHTTRTEIKTTTLYDECVEEFREMEGRAQSGSDITGLTTGFYDLDIITRGWKKGEFTIIAGRPSMGKTAIATAAAWNRGNMKEPVQLFSCEMSQRQIARRMMSSKGKVDSAVLETGKLTHEQWARVIDTVNDFGNAKDILITDSAGWSVGAVCAEARVTKARIGLGLVVVDYLQLLSAGVRKIEGNREQQVAYISKQLKILAKELDVPVIALSQLSRKVEDRADKRPLMSDLRESGALEQDADVIAFLYRDEVYNKDTPEVGLCEVSIAKNRNGSIGICRLRWTPQYTRFDSLAREQTQEEFRDW